MILHNHIYIVLLHHEQHLKVVEHQQEDRQRPREKFLKWNSQKNFFYKPFQYVYQHYEYVYLNLIHKDVRWWFFPQQMQHHLCIVMLRLFHLLQQLYSHIQLEKHDRLVKIVMHLNRTKNKNKQNDVFYLIKRKALNIHQIQLMTLFCSS